MQRTRILVVDDEPNVQAMLRICLEGPHFGIETAMNGSDALAIACRNSPDVMLLDLAMPVMDGMTLLKQLRSLPPSLRTRVIVMTAHGSVKAAIQAMRLGARDFLEKPFSPEDVRASVLGVLEDAAGEAQAGEEGYDALLTSARKALRARTLLAAEAMLTRAGVIADDDPAFLNLAGVLHEIRGRVDSARRFYERASRANDRYVAAAENLMRLNDLKRTGRSQRSIRLGDEGMEATVASLSHDRRPSVLDLD